VRDGRVILNDEILGPWQYDTRFLCKIEWTRQPFWEGALTQIPLTNTSATDDTSGITVTNSADTGTNQIETATIVGTVTGDGNATVILTAAGMTGSPISKSVALLLNDTPTQSAAKIVTALIADANITTLFNIVSSSADIIITRLVPAANDGTLNLSYANDTCTGLTDDATSTDTTAGSTTAQENWVAINDEDVLGDLPSPIKVQMYNSKNGSDASDEIYIFHNVYSTPASMDHVLEGEDATGATVTDTADATSSNGFYGSLAWTATTETLIAEWALSTTELSKYAGGRFAAIARWAAAFPYTNSYLLFKLLSDTNYIFLWTTGV